MGSVVPASPQPAIIAHAIQRNALVYATMAPRADGNQEVEEKLDRGPAQKVLMGCPEMFNEPVHSCSSCGGESATIRGQCKIANGSKFYCKCSNTGPNGKTTTVVSVTTRTDAATGTYELDTMTEYASLREHITVTTTVTASTTASADIGLETVAVVVLAGGAAWFLADAIGGAAAVAALSPPESAQDHNDDKNCPTPKNKCSACGGTDQMCRTGNDSGCACEEEDTCPADGTDNQPNCSDDSCNPQDGKCTGGGHPNCDCKEVECPDLMQYTFFCSDCGGDDGTGKCKGDPDEDPPNLWKTCECTADPDWNADTNDALVRTNVLQHQAALLALPDISAAPPQPSAAPLPKPSCDTDSVSNIPYNVFDPGVFSKFCDAISGGDRTKALTQQVDASGNVTSGTKKRTPPPNWNSYNGYSFSLEWTGGDGSCPSDCVTIFTAITNNICGHMGSEANVMTNQAELNTGCGIYSYSITSPPSTNPTTVVPSPSPPTPTVGPLQCAVNNPDYGSCWNDVHASSMEDCVDAMSAVRPGGVTSADANITQVYREGARGSGSGGSGITYMTNIGWIPECTDYPSMVPDNPLGKSGDNTISYHTIIKNTYYQCGGNSGLGGYIDVGCLRYGFYPNNVDGVFASPPHPALFWNQYPDICGS